MLDKLEDKGFIRREVDPDDRRAFLIFLTKEGRELKNILIPVVKETLEVALKGFKTEEVEQLKNLLNRIYFNFD
ncbi:MAG: MarR family transcriptional regulator [Firmicutes bacterium]|nr:MarR family transcriptional regulator [Bacillota bacterium]